MVLMTGPLVISFLTLVVSGGGGGCGGTRKLPVLAAATGRVVGYHPYHDGHSGGPLSADTEDLVKFRYDFAFEV